MKPKVLQRILAIAVTLIALVLSACSQTVVPEALTKDTFVFDAENLGEQAESRQEVLAELTTPSGSTLSFIEHEGSVALMEVGEHFSLANLKPYKPTALEVFLTFAPEKTPVPQELLEAHKRLTEERDDISLEPRTFSAEIATQRLTGPITSKQCQTSTSFKNFFQAGFFLPGNYAYEGYGLNIIWKKYGVTGQSNRRTLAACNHPLHTPFADSTPVNVRIEAQVGANLWFYVGGTSRTLNNGEGMYFISEGWTSQRYRIVADGHAWAIYSLAGAWGGKAPRFP